MKARLKILVFLLALFLLLSGLSVAVRGEALDGNVEASRETVLDEELLEYGEWHYHYDAPHRSDADGALGTEEEMVWYAAIRIDLPDIGDDGHISDIAYFDFQDDAPESADYVRGQIYTDGNDRPGDLIGETEKFEDTGTGEWEEIPLKDYVSIDPGQYWVVLEIADPGEGVYPMGIMDGYVADGGWYSENFQDWIKLPDAHHFVSWALEVRVFEGDPPEFVLDEDWSIDPSPVEANETFTIEGDIVNIGDIPGDGTVELYIDDELEDTGDMTVEGGERKPITFEHSEEKVGTYDVRVETEDDDWTGEVEVEPADPALVEIDPAEDQEITAGEIIEFSIEAYDEYDNFITAEAADLDWENAENGVFDETEVGEYDVTATYEDVSSDPVTVTVEPAEVDYVEIDPADDEEITAGETLEFEAEAYDEYDNLITDSTEEPFDFLWDNAEAALGGAEFEETKAGEYDVTASYEGVSSESVTVTVEPAEVDYVEISVEDSTISAGETIKFTAEAYDEYDNLITDEVEEFDWENADGGVFDETEAGEYDVTATYDRVSSDPVTVTVEPAEVDYVEIDPADDQVISAGETIEFTAEAYDEYDNLITDEVEDFDWEYADSGVFDETEADDYEVRTLYEGVGSDEVIVTVEPGEVNYVEIDPDEDETVDSGETIEFLARAYDEYDNLITDDPADFDWENADDGVFEEDESGDFDVSAEYNGVASDSVAVTVEAAVPGFTLALLLLASIIAVAIYHKKKQ